MKKIISVLMAVMLIFALAACSNNLQEENENQNVSTSAQQVSDTSAESDNQNDTANKGKTLVVYFSASGNTENAANYIAKATNADVFELEPKDAYTDDDLNWRDENSRVNYEHDNESARNIELVSSTVDNWESYDTIFIGYPIWWQIAAWPVDNFVKDNDFTDKTVIPFCTSTSSGLGESGKLLEQMAGTGNWLEGERFTGNVSETEIHSWIEGLGL
ncbi:MAG: flavodoxin [Eubacterium sp.]|nr:flavodoxin [Eubacterium sp.]